MSIKNLALAYAEFQNKFGQAVNEDFAQMIDTLFEVQFKKIANGVELVSTSGELEAQLSNVKSMAGNWIMDINYIIPSHDDKQCTIRYVLSTDKGGKYDIIAVLSSVDGRKIAFIDEIYYQV